MEIIGLTIRIFRLHLKNMSNMLKPLLPTNPLLWKQKMFFYNFYLNLM